MKKRRLQVLWLTVGIVTVLLVFLSLISGFLEKWLWMRELGYQAIFWRIWLTKWSLFVVSFLCVFVYLSINFRLMNKTPLDNPWRALRQVHGGQMGESVPLHRVPWTLSYLLISGFVAVMFALTFYPQWDAYLRFRWGGATGIADPVFHADTGFYLFQLPFYKLIQDGLLMLAFLTAALIFGAYLLTGAFRLTSPHRVQAERRTVAHLSVLVAVFFAVWAWGYYLDRYELMYSTQGVVYGVGYTAYHMTRISLWIMLVASIALALATLVNVFVPRFVALVAAVGGYFLLYFVVLIVLPVLVQKFWVEPSELELETPYLKNNIEFTRKAFQLDQIEEKQYPAPDGSDPE